MLKIKHWLCLLFFLLCTALGAQTEYLLSVSAPANYTGVVVSGDYSGIYSGDFQIGPYTNPFTVTLELTQYSGSFYLDNGSRGSFSFYAWHIIDQAEMQSEPSLTITMDDTYPQRTVYAQFMSESTTPTPPATPPPRYVAHIVPVGEMADRTVSEAYTQTDRSAADSGYMVFLEVDPVTAATHYWEAQNFTFQVRNWGSAGCSVDYYMFDQPNSIRGHVSVWGPGNPDPEAPAATTPVPATGFIPLHIIDDNLSEGVESLQLHIASVPGVMNAVSFPAIYIIDDDSEPVSGAGLGWLEPAVSTLTAGREFVTEVHFNTGAQVIAAYEIEVNYDPVMLSPVTNIYPGGVRVGTNGFYEITVDHTPGRIMVSSTDYTGRKPDPNLQFLKIYWQASTQTGSTDIGLTVKKMTDVVDNSIGEPVGIGAAINITDLILGDVNADGIVNIVDALMTAQYYIGLELPAFIYEAADVNLDNIVNIIDALIIAQYYVGILNTLPV